MKKRKNRKKEDKEKEIELRKEKTIKDLIDELKNNGLSYSQIRKEFTDTKCPDEFFEYLDKLNKQEVIKMSEEIEETEEEFDDEELEEQENEEPEPKVQKKPVKKIEKKEKVTIEELTETMKKVIGAIQGIEQRLGSVEASLFRIRSV